MQQFSDCKKCKYADISSGNRTFIEGNTVIRQMGGTNIRCTHGCIKSMTITDDGMICSEYEEAT